jgi:hypothetical protein
MRFGVVDDNEHAWSTGYEAIGKTQVERHDFFCIYIHLPGYLISQNISGYFVDCGCNTDYLCARKRKVEKRTFDLLPVPSFHFRS